MSDIAAIAGKLSEAMVSALTWPRATEDGRVRIVPNMLYSQTMHALARRGLTDKQDYLTPLGQQVRDHLISKEML